MPGRNHSVDELIDREALRWEYEHRRRKTDIVRDTNGAIQSGLAATGTVKPYVTLSRQFGSGALIVAEMLSKKLGWKVYDQAIVDEISRRAHVFHTEVELLDEKTGERIRDYIASLPFNKLFSQDAYHHHLVRTVTSFACQGKAIFVGRGANFILPREQGVAIRLTASLPDRIQWVSNKFRLSSNGAAELIRKTDAERSDFIQYHFGRAWDDPAAYDRIFDLSAMSAVDVVQNILALLRSKVDVRPAAG